LINRARGGSIEHKISAKKDTDDILTHPHSENKHPMTQYDRRFITVAANHFQVWGEEGLISRYTVPKATHIPEKFLGVYMGASPWLVNFQRRLNPPSFRNFRKHLTLLPLEISEKSREETKIVTAEFDLLSA
jgi:hypothetical protein